jgi:hypothetical protein
MTPLSFELAIRLGRNQAKRFRYVYYAFLFGLRSKFKKKTRLLIFQRKFRAGRSDGRAWACARWPALSGAVGGVRRGGRRYGLEGKMARGVSGRTLFVRPGIAPRPLPDREEIRRSESANDGKKEIILIFALGKAVVKSAENETRSIRVLPSGKLLPSQLLYI